MRKQCLDYKARVPCPHQPVMDPNSATAGSQPAPPLLCCPTRPPSLPAPPLHADLQSKDISRVKQPSQLPLG